MKKSIFAISISFILLSCQTTDNYENLQTFKNEFANFYFLENLDSHDLVINIEGSGYESVLGLKNDDGSWKYKKSASQIINMTKKDFNVLLPEKLFYEIGKNYNDDEESLKQADVNSLTNSYSESIDTFLDNKVFNNIILIGSSDGAALLPKIYSQLRNKNKITKIISISGGGGYTQLDEFRILSKSDLNMPENYRALLLKVDEVYDHIKKNPESIENFYLGHPYKRWSSFFNYLPLDYIEQIDIPILFLHGEKDWSCPVESTKYIEEKNISDKFEFIYYKNMEHGPRTIFEMIQIRNDIMRWIKQ